MKTLPEIQYQLQAGEFEFTRHAFKRAVERNISDREIIESGANVTSIEDYPDDKYSPSCLLLGLTVAARALHLQVSRMDSDLLKVIAIAKSIRTFFLLVRAGGLCIPSGDFNRCVLTALAVAISLFCHSG